MLRIAIQKSGRLHEDSLSLLKECGIKVRNGNGQLKSVASNFPLEVYFLRDDDIPQYVSDGVADVGIIGKNVFLEKEKDIRMVTELGFGQCRLSIAMPKSSPYQSFKDLAGKKIATSYPNLLRKFLEERKVPAEIHNISGSVEIAPGIGLADAICDLVSSGSTLFTNGLREVETILYSEAVLVNNRMAETGETGNLFRKLLFRIESVKNAANTKYIMLNVPNVNLDKIFNVLPGLKSPTVVPLAEEGWSSVQSVVKEDVFWEVIEKLKSLKAEGILVMPIEKMVL
ncbi:MAG: ATP phosphoribosyltransferase [Chitinophagaceae bacterium]|nr:ATP phosphoribosyltransferase [Chitinophagaceae bacterium]